AAKDYYYLYNGHGDVVQIVNTSGTPVNTYSYDEWGNITSQTEGIQNSFKYAGEIYDAETGLYYLRARYYDPSIGRFLNEDTVEGQIDNPLSQNLYTYVSNNPLRYIDPSGHDLMEVYIYEQTGYHKYKSDLQYLAMNVEEIISYHFYGGEEVFNLLYSKDPEVIAESLKGLAISFVPFGSAGKVAAKVGKKVDKAGDVTKLLKKAYKCNCFTAGTKVQTDEGEKNIEDIEVGDKVLSKDEITGEVAYKEVTATFNHETNEIYKIHVGDQTIESTFNHPFYVKDKGWTFVKDLKAGDLLVQSDGNTLKIESNEVEHRQAAVYNLRVDGFHTYFVSDLSIWVHNTNCWGKFSTDDLKKLGQADQKDIKRITGNANDAFDFFKEQVSSYREVSPGVFVGKDTNGVTFTYRASSKSGPPTIDLNGISGVRKIKFLED
ncbi:hypothetical protein BSK56_33475, partial [Paenibacillus borealis]